MSFVYEMYNMMSSRNLILVYEGEFTQEITKAVLSMTEKNMDHYGEEFSIKRKVFNVMVECLQNICKHSEVREHGRKAGAIFMVGKEDSSYFVVTGNPIESSKVTSLSERLENINSMDSQGLKALYRDVIKNTTISEKGGAGLGFIDIARKSRQKLEFSFEDIGGGISFFALKTTISRQ